MNIGEQLRRVIRLLGVLLLVATSGAMAQSGLVDDIRHNIISAHASAQQPGEEIEKSTDGVIESGKHYHSPWTGGRDIFPITLEYDLDDATLDYIIYHPRTDVGYNGNFREVDILVATRRHPQPKLYKSLDLQGRNTPSIIAFDKSIKGATKVIFVVKSGSGDGAGFAACAQMEFYAYNPNHYDPTKLFTDANCTTLRRGVNERDIERCPSEFYRILATKIYADRYDREFRIAKFEPRIHPDIEARERRMGSYSLLDNATGVEAVAGEEFVVFADEVADQQNISIRIYDLYDTKRDGFANYETMPIHSGLNRYTPKRTGLAYVIYHVDEPSQAPAAALHFATGRVNGYYDSQRHTPQDCRRLLANATDRHFDILGKYVHMVMPTSSIRQFAGDDLPAVIDHYDEMVRREQEFMGFGDELPYLGNRLYMQVCYHSMYMYATSYRTCYHISTMKPLLTLATIKQSAWGQAHEIGHINQTRPLLKWIGLTEVTNNIMSLYIQTEMLGQKSRLTDENRYARAHKLHDSYTAGTVKPFGDYDIWSQLVMFWQLYLYQTKAQGQDDLYAKIYSWARTHKIPHMANGAVDNGACQLAFAVAACDAAQLDLTEFFDYWGLFEPTSKVVDDYGKASLVITEAMANEARQKIKSKGYPRPSSTLPLWQITDGNWSEYSPK